MGPTYQKPKCSKLTVLIFYRFFTQFNLNRSWCHRSIENIINYVIKTILQLLMMCIKHMTSHILNLRMRSILYHSKLQVHPIEREGVHFYRFRFCIDQHISLSSESVFINLPLQPTFKIQSAKTQFELSLGKKFYFSQGLCLLLD